MAWFDRGFGEKKGSQAEAAKPAVPDAAKAEPIRTKSLQPAIAKGEQGGISEPAHEPLPDKVAPPVEPRPARAETQLVGHLYKGSRVCGQLMFQGPARIDGNVEGEIQCHGTLTIGEGADIRGKIFSQVVIIRGKVEGTVSAREKVELVAPGRVVGNISAPRLTVTEGVVFDGDCSMGVARNKNGVAGSQAVSTDKAAPAQQSDSHK